MLWTVIIGSLYAFDKVTNINIQESITMSRRLPDGFKERVRGGNVHAAYIEAFDGRGMTLCFAETALERLHWK